MVRLRFCEENPENVLIETHSKAELRLRITNSAKGSQPLRRSGPPAAGKLGASPLHPILSGLRRLREPPAYPRPPQAEQILSLFQNPTLGQILFEEGQCRLPRVLGGLRPVALACVVEE